MTMRPTCEICGDPTDATVCRRETSNLAGHLRQVITVADEVETSVARLARHGDRGGRPTQAAQHEPDDDSDEHRRLPVMTHGWVARLDRPQRAALRVTELPYHPGMRQRAHAATKAITTTAHDISQIRGIPTPRPRPTTGPLCRAGLGCQHHSCALIRARTIDHPAARAARFLLTQLDWIRRHGHAVDYIETLTAAAAILRRCVDRPPTAAYAGPCWTQLDDGRCDYELYAPEGASTVTCGGCGTVHTLDLRRRWLLGEAQDTLAIAATIAAGLTSLDMPVTSSMIRNYAGRGRILAHGHDPDGRPLYRVGDVIDVILDIRRHRASAVA